MDYEELIKTGGTLLTIAAAAGGAAAYAYRKIRRVVAYVEAISEAQATASELRAAVHRDIVPAVQEATRQSAANNEVLKGLTAKIEQMAATVQKELRPNGGSSIFDMITDLRIQSVVSDAKWKVLASTTGVAMLHYDAAGLLLWTSPEFLRLTGAVESDFVGDAWRGMIPEEDQARVYALWDQAVAQRRAFYCRHGLLAAGGRIVFVEVQSQPLFTSDKKLRGWLGVVKPVPPRDKPAIVGPPPSS